MDKKQLMEMKEYMEAFQKKITDARNSGQSGDKIKAAVMEMLEHFSKMNNFAGKDGAKIDMSQFFNKMPGKADKK
ncbi:hypothetical protein [Brevibacillus dissolubilis]|uniref:hypothetical protein n=1 Tax=Brevibacillus dissolubilis TaxID=1844116 RepID=UPI001116D9DC|nr:hypothetical protein [Brevibacillus dissolubilis]